MAALLAWAPLPPPPDRVPGTPHSWHPLPRRGSVAPLSETTRSDVIWSDEPAWLSWPAILLALGAPLAACAPRAAIERPAEASGSSASGQTTRPCLDAVAVAAPDVGLVRCADGRTHRPQPAECPSAIEPGPAGMPGQRGECQRDSDCTNKPHGHCEPALPLSDTYCFYGCRVDADCADSELCHCGPKIGQCVPATCRSMRDCGEGLLCTMTRGDHHPSFACDSPADECNRDEDCPPADGVDRSCDQVDDVRRCVVGGRPVY